MSTDYTIGDLAREFAITTRTIRHYEEQGLLHPQRKGAARIFSSRDRGRLKLALRAKRVGFPLNEIRELFELFDMGRSKVEQLPQFLDRLERRRAILERQREDVTVMLDEIAFFSAQCRRSLAGERSETQADHGESMPEGNLR